MKITTDLEVVPDQGAHNVFFISLNHMTTTVLTFRSLSMTRMCMTKISPHLLRTKPHSSLHCADLNELSLTREFHYVGLTSLGTVLINVKK